MLKKNFELSPGWFYENHKVLHSGKCHHLIELGYKTLPAEDEQKFLGIIIDKNLNF